MTFDEIIEDIDWKLQNLLETPDGAKFKEEIEKAREQLDTILVNLHYGDDIQ